MLAKKTGSTDNLTGHLGTAKSTDCLIKEVDVHNFLFFEIFSNVLLKNCEIAKILATTEVNIGVFNI